MKEKTERKKKDWFSFRFLRENIMYNIININR